MDREVGERLGREVGRQGGHHTGIECSTVLVRDQDRDMAVGGTDTQVPVVDRVGPVDAQVGALQCGLGEVTGEHQGLGQALQLLHASDHHRFRCLGVHAQRDRRR